MIIRFNDQIINIIHDSFSHIRHDLEGQINKPTEEMTPEEQNFYYFKLHDTNNDNRLDGLEVIAAFDHVHEEEYAHEATIDGQNNTVIERLDDEELTKLVDDILKEEDLDHDGFISYEEFKHALEKDKMTQR
jgi:Ca2+-binding EF-hand superfamily protein